MKSKIHKVKTLIFLMIGLFLLASPVYSAIYHIDPEANAGGDGSYFSPFNSWWNLPLRTMKTGDQVYFKCNTTYSPGGVLSIGWEGTANNPAVIGSYYIENKKPIYGVKGNRPIISGSNYRVPENNLHGDRDSYLGLIHVSSKDYVHIKNLHILEAGYYGIRVVGNLDAETNSAHFLIKNVKTEGSYSDGIQSVYNANNHGIIEDCEVLGAQYGWHVGARSGWGGAIGTVSSPYSNITIRRNYIHHNWGEGILTIRPGRSGINSGYAIIEDNVVWNNRRVDIYIDRTEGNIVRRNFLLGAGASLVGSFSSSARDGRGWNQFGIWINTEKRAGDMLSTSNNSVYNNLIAGHSAGMGISSEYEEGNIENVFFYNNTLIGNRTNIAIGRRLSGYTMTNVEFKNNISYCPQDTICQDIGSDKAWYDSKIKFDYNAWTVKPENFGGPNNETVNENWVKTQGWQELKDIPNINDFAMTEGNPAINRGTFLGNFEKKYVDYKKAIDRQNTNFNPYSASGISVATIDQSGTRWDMGAVLYESQHTTNPVTPLAAPDIKMIEPVN